ncbi:hypothetical protein GD627_12075 [Arthrobacter yangruifuii]|uniref:Uncharacterized protein n=1 Tax=Arthrobacter yangruifuii TaxID=2606616 RepID=A0A5N6MFL1_9MICC|nr:hypothetical protein [Arthrobacter yangruifuii]KAD3515039.1 hypothetical protein GD627_12075 [Arthrobacter yangruifuii]
MESIERIPGPDAFAGATPLHVASQASQLLCIARALRPKDSDQDRLADQNDLEDLHDLGEDAWDLGAPLPRRAGPTSLGLPLKTLFYLALTPKTQRYPHSEALEGLEGYAYEIITVDTVEDSSLLGRIRRLYENIQNFRSARSAFALLYLCTRSPHELVRAASVSALYVLHERSRAELLPLVREAAASGNPEVAQLAAAAEWAENEEHSKSDSPSTPIEGSEGHGHSQNLGADEGQKAADRTADLSDPGYLSESVSLAIHGTYARIKEKDKKWFEPDAKLPTRISTSCSPDLYRESDYFRWSAVFSEPDRAFAALQLVEWCKRKGISSLDTVYAHSHGGNVILNAILKEGIKVNLLVLLHVPVLRRTKDEWALIEERVGWILDLRTRHDLVVRMDSIKNRSKNGFGTNLNCITQPQGPPYGKWTFSHGYFVDDDTWQAINLPNDVTYERSQIASNRLNKQLPPFTPW